MSVAKSARKTLLQLGAKGAVDRVRVLEDAKADEVVVQYKDATHRNRKRIFPNTRQGKKDATEWARTYHSTRALTGGLRKQVTHAELWKAYAESPAFARCRERTQGGYLYRWKKWMHFRGEKTRVDDTTLHHVDQYYSAAKAAGMAVNQIRQVINVARIVYNWGQSRKLVSNNELVLYRWSTPKGEEPLEPEEYSEPEFNAIIGQLSPQHGGTWRAHVALMLAGHQGVRANAALHLAWPDVHEDEALFMWPAQYQKNGLAFPQPMTWDAVAALETARYWRTLSGYEGQWVLFAGGGNKSLGSAPVKVGVSRQRHYSRKTTRSYRKERGPEQDTPYTYQALWRALQKAEKSAKVEHKERRALHGFRKMVAGNVADRTGDDRLGMEFLGDRDMKMAKKYLKHRSERMERAADSVQTNPERTAKAEGPTVLEVSAPTDTQTAPETQGPQPTVIA